MIKGYSQFIKENDEFVDTSVEETEEENLEQEFDQADAKEPMEAEEEAGDIYTSKLNELAEKLGVEATDGKIEYNDQKIIFPSETKMYHVGRKKFKTSDEVVDYLKGSKNKAQKSPENEEELGESKSYKNRFKI